MQDVHCLRRMRIRVRGLEIEQTRKLYQSLLLMIDGVVSIKVNSLSGRMLIIYDDRKITSWQLTALAGRLESSPHSLLSASHYALRKHQMYLIIPLALLVGLLVKRLISGKPKFADNLVAYELATLVAVFTGYPQLRRYVKRFADKIGTSDHLLLSSAALFVAVIRESFLVITALYLLTYNSYRKRNNTLVAAAKAGEVVALIDSENREPKNVQQYAEIVSKLGLLLALSSLLITRDPLLFSTLLVAFNPRPAVVSARYGLNHAEILTHEDCRYIPMHTGMDLYELLDAREIVILSTNDAKNPPKIFPPLAEFAKMHHISSIYTLSVSEFTEPIPDVRERERHANRPIEKIVLLSEEVIYPAVHQRQDHLIYLRQSQQALLETLRLSARLRDNITRNLIYTSVVSLTLTALSLGRVHPNKINLLADGYTIASLGLAESSKLSPIATNHH
ncbi:hypothetical protein [Sulfoacidibacillus thermotolerans]|uniref:HMA domain-containing protein n=1 Tax=Sulfoacidibacillus thermotolerans TaxID=1765684 RepID=A0A2U3D8V0_SULT2|nr:hypothetical protein [Sulfoacidibacillus thermotolerans]PWI57714.1 hypothetical protein BM613_06930 [Sulfoacidibacillus thermotolerans]